MIKPEQIPSEVVNKAISAFADADGRQDNWMRQAISAAINAWPDGSEDRTMTWLGFDAMILPLPQEKNDA